MHMSRLCHCSPTAQVRNRYIIYVPDPHATLQSFESRESTPDPELKISLESLGLRVER